jgi:hypothetical protein
MLSRIACGSSPRGFSNLFYLLTLLIKSFPFSPTIIRPNELASRFEADSFFKLNFCTKTHTHLENPLKFFCAVKQLLQIG